MCLCVCLSICLLKSSPGLSILLTIPQRLGQGPHKQRFGTQRPTTAQMEQVSSGEHTFTYKQLMAYISRCVPTEQTGPLSLSEFAYCFLYTCLFCLRFSLITGCPLVAWRNTLEDWAAEDWSEDVSVSWHSVTHYRLVVAGMFWWCNNCVSVFVSFCSSQRPKCSPPHVHLLLRTTSPLGKGA